MKKLILISIAALTLSACGGGGSDSPTPTPTPTPKPKVMPAGIWVGDITYTNGSVDDAYVLIAPGGEARFIDSNEQGKAKITLVDHEKYTATMESFGTSYAKGSMSGTYSETTFKGEAVFGGTKASDFTFEKSASTNEGASFEMLKGNYVNIDNSASVAIDIDGVISGSDIYGCQFVGEVTIPDALINIYELVINVSNCGQRSGQYTGLATYTKLFTDLDSKQLVYQADNGSFSFTQILFK